MFIDPFFWMYMSVDPRWVDPAQHDYHLRPDSPAIDTLYGYLRLPEEFWIQEDLDFIAALANDVGCYWYIPPVVETPILATNTPTSTPTPTWPADLHFDGRIDALDVFELSLHWNGTDESSRKADLDQSGTVDAADLLILIEALSK